MRKRRSAFVRRCGKQGDEVLAAEELRGLAGRGIAEVGVGAEFEQLTTDHSLSEALRNTPGAGGNLMQWVLNWNPTQSFYNSTGGLNLLENNVPNPLAALQAYSDQSYVSTVLGNISANVEILHNLNYKFMYAINDGSGRP